VLSAIEMLHDIALYKFNIHIHIHIGLTVVRPSLPSSPETIDNWTDGPEMATCILALGANVFACTYWPAF